MSKKKPLINKTIKKGITTTTIPDALTINNKQLHQKKKELLKNLILDETLLDIMIKPENMKKLAYRLEYRIEIKNENNETLGKTGTFNKTPEQVIQELKEKIKKGEEIKGEVTPTISKKLQDMNYKHYEHIQNGKINKINTQIIFRKAK